MTADLERLLGYHVRVTNPDNKSAWEGWLVSLSDQPSLVIERIDGTRVTLPQSFTVAGTGRIATVAQDHVAPRPENVVKAEELRELLKAIDSAPTLDKGDVRNIIWMRIKELDPPPPECGHELDMLADVGELWKRGICVATHGHGGEHLYRVTSEKVGESS